MRILAAAFFVMAVIPNAGAADLSRPYPRIVYERDAVVIVRPVRRVIKTRHTCVRCSRLPLGGLREPIVAHVPLGGLRKACPPAVGYTVREDVVLRVKG
jgi:hypothetical protein